MGVLLPTLGVFVAHGWPIFSADRYAYIPTTLLVPWCAGIGHAVVERRQRQDGQKQKQQGGQAKKRNSNTATPCLNASLALLLACLSLQSFFGASKWTQSSSLWEHAVGYGPNDVVAHYNLVSK